jgi:hypothetical protein
MKFDIKSRWDNSVIFTAEIEATDDTPVSIRLGLAVKAACKVRANLRGAYLGGADLGGADLRGAYLGGADLRGANLGGAYLRGADLEGANLRGADLEGANLRGAYLGGADLEGANLGGLILLPARATRSDGFEYFAWTSVLGGMVIKAGCREWVGEDAIEQARRHCETKTSAAYRAEALRIVAHIEAAWNEHRAALAEVRV